MKDEEKCKSLKCLGFTSLNIYFSPPKEHTLYIESVHPHRRVHQYQIQNPVKRADDQKMGNTWLLTSWWQSTSQQNPEPFFSTRQNRTVTGSSIGHTHSSCSLMAEDLGAAQSLLSVEWGPNEGMCRLHTAWLSRFADATSGRLWLQRWFQRALIRDAFFCNTELLSIARAHRGFEHQPVGEQFANLKRAPHLFMKTANYWCYNVYTHKA